MAANDQYLLYCPAGQLSLLDEQGIKKYRCSNCNNITDIHWSSYLNEFLILCQYGELYALNPINNESNQMKKLKKFGEEMITLSCHQERLLLATSFVGSIIQEYDLSNWNLIKTYKPVVSCQKHEIILEMRFSSTGKHLAFVLKERDHPEFVYWVELRQSSDLAVLQVLKLGNESEMYSLLSLPNDQFLVNTYGKVKKFFLINGADSENIETFSYESTAQIQSTALINGHCLVLQIGDPCRSGELRFYDL